MNICTPRPEYDGRPNGHGSINIACKVSLPYVSLKYSRIHQAYVSKLILSAKPTS